jgi:hypothetical protein
MGRDVLGVDRPSTQSIESMELSIESTELSGPTSGLSGEESVDARSMLSVEESSFRSSMASWPPARVLAALVVAAVVAGEDAAHWPVVVDVNRNVVLGEVDTLVAA